MKKPVNLFIIPVLCLLLSGCIDDPQPKPIKADGPIDQAPGLTWIGTSTPFPSVPAPVTATLPPTDSPTLIPDLPLDRLTDDHGVEMIRIPAGEFIMGSEDGFPDEVPVHTVYLDTYYIDRFETTNAEYQRCVIDGACEPPRQFDCCAHQAVGTILDYYGNPAYDNYPVTWTNWYDAINYCEWRGVRLPTEAEWEKAARGTDGRTYPWGNDDPTPAHLNFNWPSGTFDQEPLGVTAPVGSYSLGASPYGVLDMAGNVYEWVQDVYAVDYYSRSPYENPTGPDPDDGGWRIARGGSFWNQAYRNRSSNRNNAYLPADLAHFDAGIRCAMDDPYRQ